ncbi:hypothetical protein AYO44_00035 [Planctomycetaceae bacterium SCGC AG-212-F19]|nr:hypothetical protein AYO44_00035 [Planctomycetaceae bacterium SCGC AG-212-F19]
MRHMLTGLVALIIGLMAIGTAGAADDAAGKKKADPEALFKKLDTDGDGKISKAEFSAFVDKLKAKLGDKGDKAAKALDGLFEKLDKNKDGYLSLEEFKAFKGAGGKGKPGGKKPNDN